jgi:hypothetical protein
MFFRPRLEILEDRLVFDVAISVDATSGLHAIAPTIYGTAFASTSALLDLNLPLNRSGGNATTTYNWQQNVSNRASDWYFESIPEAGGAGASADTFVRQSFNGGADPMLTVPTIDWVARTDAQRHNLPSFSVARYGPQQAHDPYNSDAGNGVHTNGTFVTGNNPNDANTPNSPDFEQGWLNHLVNQWGNSDNGGVRYYLLDNEPSIWHATHRDIHPTGATMDEIFNKTIAYAGMIRSVDPDAAILGPEEWGWSGYFYSGYDQQYGSQHGWSNLPDRRAHGNQDYLPWLLDQLYQYDSATGQRSLDYFSLHYYPQGGEFGNDVSAARQRLRNQSTRSLWDPNYVDQSWIGSAGPDGGRVRLIPRMHQWVDTYYPGLQTALTEYNWGAEGHMNGATTQADLFGIFGREGLDLANRWTTPAAGSPTYLAMKMYRDYDNADGTFGDTSVSTTVPNPDLVSAFSATRSYDGALTVMIVNKDLYSASNPLTTVSVDLNGFAGNGTAQVWQLAAINPNDQTRAAITQLSDLGYDGSQVTLDVPKQSVTLLVFWPAGAGAGPARTGPGVAIVLAGLRPSPVAATDPVSDPARGAEMGLAPGVPRPAQEGAPVAKSVVVSSPEEAGTANI